MLQRFIKPLGKRRELNSIIGTLFTIVTLISLLISGVLLIGSRTFLIWLKMPEQSMELGIHYLLICGGGLFFTAGYNMVSSVLRGMGDSKRPLLFIAIASILNLLLDLLFTGLLGWGVAGAAWATIIGQAVSFLFALYYLARHREAFGFDFKIKSFRINLHHAKLIASLGIPMAIQSSFIHISMLFVNSLINSAGVVASATFGVGIRIDDIFTKISMGIQYAAIPMISQNIGARNPKRAQKIVYWSWVYSGIFVAIFLAFYIFLGKEMFMLFSDDPAVHNLAPTFIRGILWIFPAFAIMRGSGAFIQGIGAARLSMILALLDGFVLRIGLSWLFGVAFGLGFYGFVLGYALSVYGFAIPSFFYFISGRWKKRRILAEKI